MPEETSTIGERRLDERHRIHTERQRNYALYFTIALQIIATVWGAASLAATVGQLRESVRGQSVLNATFTKSISDVTIDVAVIKDRESRSRR